MSFRAAIFRVVYLCLSSKIIFLASLVCSYIWIFLMDVFFKLGPNFTTWGDFGPLSGIFSSCTFIWCFTSYSSPFWLSVFKIDLPCSISCWLFSFIYDESESPNDVSFEPWTPGVSDPQWLGSTCPKGAFTIAVGVFAFTVCEIACEES